MTLLLAILLATQPVLTDPAILAAQSWVESRNDPKAVSCPLDPQPGTHDSTRRIGRRRPCFCGIYQTRAETAAECIALRDPHRALAARQAEMVWWLRYCGGRIECALAGYGSGTKAARRGTSRYARRVLRLAERMRFRGQDRLLARARQ
jgi:hypothetical protein